MNLLDEDLEGLDHEKFDDFNENGSDNNDGNAAVSIDFSEENPVSIKKMTTNQECNKNEIKNPNNLAKISENHMIYKNLKAQLKRRNVESTEDGEDDDELNDDLVAKLLDPFEQLEREFNWDNVEAIKPPSAFNTANSSNKPPNIENKPAATVTKDSKRKTSTMDTNEYSNQIQIKR